MYGTNKQKEEERERTKMHGGRKGDEEGKARCIRIKNSVPQEAEERIHSQEKVKGGGKQDKESKKQGKIR